MRAVLPSSAPSRPEPGPAAGAFVGAAGDGRRRDLAVALVIALVPVALYARTLGWPALEVGDAELCAAGSLAEAARAGGAGGASLFVELGGADGSGDSAFVARAVTLVLFAGASALAFGLARALGLRRAASTLVALLFAVHPLQVEGLAWLSQRGPLLGGFCFLLGARLWLGGGALRTALAAGALVLALLAEPRLFGGLAWLVLVERRVLHQRTSRLRLALACALFVGAGWTLVGSGVDVTRFAQAPRALGALGWHALVPVGLTPHHGPPAAAHGMLALDWLALGLLAWGLLRLGRRRPRVALGALLFVLLGAGQVLFPRSEDLFRESDAALALLGLALALAAGTEYLVRPGLLFGTALVLVWTLRTHARLEAWRSEPALQAAALAARPDDARAHAALAKWHLLHGRVSTAQAASERALALQPSDPAALFLRGEIELRRAGVAGQEQHLERAKEFFDRSLRAPSAAARVIRASRERRAELHRLQGEPQAARTLLDEVLRAEPGRSAAHARLGRVELDLGEPARARAAFRRALELDPRSPEAWCGLGLVALREDEPEAAAGAFERALELEPDLVEANARLGRVRELAGDAAAAERHYRRALAIAPDRGDDLQVETLYALGALLSASGRGEEALRVLERVVALTPAPPHVRAYLESARLRMARGEREVPRQRIAAVLAHNPAHAEALALQARLESGTAR